MSTPENTGRPGNDDRTEILRPASGEAGAVAAGRGPSLRHDVVAREKEQFGGMKFGAAFFGWLTATGMAVILTAIVAAAGAAVGLANNVDATKVKPDQAQTVGVAGAIALVVILFLSYYCGGYVAGRMARFNGVKQGVAVWLWALIIAVLAAILGTIAGSQFNILANLNSFPRIPVNEGTLTIGGIITAIVVALIALVGAILGGLAGMRYHRKVDAVGLGS
jgi:amino acid transporter